MNNKEELEKEAEEWLCNNLHSASEEDFIKAMIDIAEPREKQIAELSKHIVELQKDKGELIDRCRELEKRCNELFFQVNEKTERIAELEKENAELKDDNKVMADNYSKMEQKFYDNLTKAKVFIRSLKSLIEDVCDINYLSKDNTRLLVEAEQFLSEVEE